MPVWVCAYKNFLSCKTVPPSLAVSIESSCAENLDVLAAPFPESDGLLEGVVEVVVLPVCDIVGELMHHD
jgi:hypothetical protein